MKEKVLGFPQSSAIELGLEVVDLMLYDIVAHSQDNEMLVKLEHEGKTYTMIRYDSIIEYLPILRIKKRALGNRLAKLCEVGLIEKYVSKGNRLATCFRVSDNADHVIEITKQGRSNDVPYTNRNTNREEKKEKDNNKLLSQKKEEAGGFKEAFAEFGEKAAKDPELAYNLEAYKITDFGALLESYRKYLTDTFQVSEFMKYNYMRRRQWLMRALKVLDLTEATGIKLGKGEYMKDGKRYYIHPKGIEKEVPIDAPPRQLTSQVWYVDEERWGPQL